MMTIRDVMTTSVLTVRPDTPLKDVARLLIDSDVSGVPVIDDQGAVLGVVSEGDFLVKEQGPQALRHRRLARLLGESEATRRQIGKVAARTAGEAMTTPAVTMEPSRSIQDAAAVMTERRVNRLPVVESGRLIGIVTRADLVRAYLRTDEELVRTIRQDVLHRVLWLDPASFDVTVHNGEAVVRGNVERRSTARIVEEAIAMVPGIDSLTADVGWSFDDRDLVPASRDVAFPYGIE
jgi:CBS domain-containing protein